MPGMAHSYQIQLLGCAVTRPKKGNSDVADLDVTYVDPAMSAAAGGGDVGEEELTGDGTAQLTAVTLLGLFEAWTEIEGAHDFHVLPAHIALLHRENTGWEGHAVVGAPSLVRKRPF